jgi:hypothetical protein
LEEVQIHIPANESHEALYLLAQATDRQAGNAQGKRCGNKKSNGAQHDRTFHWRVSLPYNRADEGPLPVFS